MTRTSTISGLIKLAKEETSRVAMRKDATSNPTVKSAIEAVLVMLASKSGNDRQFVELAEKVRAALK